MSRKILKEEFLNRFYKRYEEAKIEIIEYDGISKPCTLKCAQCGKVFSKMKANDFIKSWNCCGAIKTRKIDWLSQYYDKKKDFVCLKSIGDGSEWIFRHNVCGGEFKRDVGKQFGAPDFCPYCNNKSQKLSLSFQEAKEYIEEQIGYQATLLEYNLDRSRHNKFRCVNCGMIFENSFGALRVMKYPCPRCSKIRSKGEQKLSKIFFEHNIDYQQEYGFDDLPRLRFDFAIFKDSNLFCLLECQGEQHTKFIPHIHKDFLNYELLKKNDQRKKEYCELHNIPLYYVYWDGKDFSNFDIIKNIIGSTTISDRGE